MWRLLILVLCLLGGAAHAQKRSDVQKARAHYKAGEAFFNAGIWDRAIEEYKAAYALAPRPQLLFNIGSAYRRKAETSQAFADLRAALDHYRDYLAAEPDGLGAADARAYLEKLAPAVEDAERAEARKPKPPPEPEPEPPPPVEPIELPGPPPLAVDERPRSTRGWRVAGLVSAAAGVALVGTGVAFGARARAASDDLQGPRDAWDQALFESGRRDERIMIALVAAGGVAIVGGGVMVLVLGRERKVAVTPAPLPGGAAVVVGGTID